MRYNIGCVYALLGRIDLALDYLEAVLAKTTASARWYQQWMQQDTDLDPLRSHPRFQAMMAPADSAISDRPPAESADTAGWTRR